MSEIFHLTTDDGIATITWDLPGANMNVLNEQGIQELDAAVDQVLATPDETVEKRLEAISLKKLLKGEGSWNTRKVILCWIVDTVRQTIEMPAH